MDADFRQHDDLGVKLVLIALLSVTTIAAAQLPVAQYPATSAYGAAHGLTPRPLSSPLLIDPNDPAEALARYLRTLADSPNDLAALTGAGRAALAIGDANAALAFYARAEEIAPRDGRIKAGLGSAMLQLEKPKEAIGLFGEATDLGVADGDVASDRGLAWDLRGDTRRAQRDYAIALKANPDDETTRRMALSLAISGDAEGANALLDPLLRRQDRAAWRARAFILAMSGDVAKADVVARSAMSPAQVAALHPFLVRLAGLRPAQKALAANFGEMPSDGRSYSAGELAAIDGQPPIRADSALVPAGTPWGPRHAEAAPVDAEGDGDSPISTAPRRRPGLGDAVAFAVLPVERAPTPAAPSSPPPRPTPIIFAPAAAAPAPPFFASAAPAPMFVAPAASAPPTVAAPDATPLAAAGAEPSPSLSALDPAIGERARVEADGAPRPVQLAAAQAQGPAIPPPLDAGAAQDKPIALPPVGYRLPPAAKPVPAAPPATESQASPAAEPAKPRPKPPAETPAERDKPASGPDRGDRGEHGKASGEKSDAAPKKPVARTDGAKALADADDEPSARKSTKPAGKKDAAAKEDDGAKAAGKASTKKDAAGKASAKKDAADAKKDADGKASAKKEVADGKTDAKSSARKSATDKDAKDTKDAKAKDAGKKASAKKDDDDEAAAKADAKSGKHPQRVWVQVAGGATKEDLPKAWSKLKGKAPALAKGQSVYTTPLRATNRLLVGPFKSADEAQAYVNRMSKSGLSGFTFTSDKGQQVDKLDTGK